MRVERFLADDMRQAMSRVREKLGNDALILSNRRINGQTEIIAAAEDAPAAKMTASKAAAAVSLPDAGTTQARKKKTVPGKTRRPAERESLSDIKLELSRLRNMFEGELSQLAWRDAAERQPNKIAIQNRLEMAGLNSFVSKMIMERVMPCKDLDQAWQNALKTAARLVKIPGSTVMEEGGILALLGSTGVGKTTSAAKIASQFAARYGANEVALISADNLRVGGKEQLLSYGSAMGIPVQFVAGRDDLERTLSSLSQKRLVIIDTAGMSLRDMNLSKNLQEMQVANRRIHSCLVLSATTQESIIHDTIKKFACADLQSAIVTRTDECGSLGPVMSNLIRHQLPLSMVGTGPGVPDDMIKPDARFLLGNLVKNYKLSVSQARPKGVIPALRSVVNG